MNIYGKGKGKGILVSIIALLMIASVGVSIAEQNSANETNAPNISPNDLPAVEGNIKENKSLPTKAENEQRFANMAKNAERFKEILQNPKVTTENVVQIQNIPTEILSDFSYTNPITGISNFGTYISNYIYSSSYTNWASYSFYLPTTSYVNIEYSGDAYYFKDVIYYVMYVDGNLLNSGYENFPSDNSYTAIQKSRSTYLTKGWHTIDIGGNANIVSSYYYVAGYLSIMAFPEYTAITVLAPNGGETWYRGNTKTITWKKDGNPGANVKIELYKAGVLSSVIASKTANDGSYSWYIPTYTPTGIDYKIKITSYEEPTKYFDWSNNNFKIY